MSLWNYPSATTVDRLMSKQLSSWRFTLYLNISSNMEDSFVSWKSQVGLSHALAHHHMPAFSYLNFFKNNLLSFTLGRPILLPWAYILEPISSVYLLGTLKATTTVTLKSEEALGRPSILDNYKEKIFKEIGRPLVELLRV